jgi:hypothetical protein
MTCKIQIQVGVGFGFIGPNNVEIKREKIYKYCSSKISE